MVRATLALATLAVAAAHIDVVTFNNTLSPKVQTALAAHPHADSHVFCDGCINFAEQGIGALVKVIAGGIPSSCALLCGAAFGGGALGDVCNILCDIGGLDEFVNLLSNADISPIWFCMELDACPTSTCTQGCVKVTDFDVSPTSAGPPGHFTLTYNLVFAAGVGTVTSVVAMKQLNGQGLWGSDSGTLLVSPPANSPVPVSLVSHLEMMDGNQTVCPPAGNWLAEAGVCFGACGDHFKISGGIMGTSTPTQFTITAGNNCGGGAGKYASREPKL